MELIRDFGNVNNKYTQKIKITKYTEGENLVVEKSALTIFVKLLFHRMSKNMIQSRKIIEKTL